MLLVLLAACSHHPDTAGSDGKGGGGGGATADSADSADSGDSPCADVTVTAAVFDAFDATASDCDLEVLTDWAVDRRTEFASPYNEYLQVARSDDGGASFALVADHLLEHAGVPEAVVGDDGVTRLYYVDGDFDELLEHVAANDGYLQTHGWQGPGGFAMATSTDGVTFTEDPDFEVEGIAHAMVVDPDIVRDADGTWRMYFVGVDVRDELEGDTWADDTEHDLYVATSTDLEHWVAEPEPVLTGPYADPTVTCLTDTDCLLFSFGLDEATSSDGGLSWDFEDLDSPPAFGPEFAASDDGSMLLYFNTMEPGAAIRILQSFDGTIWNYKAYDVMPDTYGEAPTIVTGTGDTRWMYTHAYVGGEPADSGG